jgi:PAS domain S-box-containing protein
MDDYGRTKAELVEELVRARQKVAAMEHQMARLAPGPEAAEGNGHARRMRTHYEYESKLRCLTEQSLVGVFLIRDGFFTYANCEMADIFGYAIDEIVERKKPVDLGFPEDCCPVGEQADIRLPGEAGSMQYEFRGKRKDGQAVYVEVYATPTVDRGVPAVLGLLLDKTDQKKLGAQLVRSERIKAIGTLAGGIAHDFNNLLMGIQGHTSLLLHRLDPADPIYGKLKGIEELVKSASDLTKKLLGFASGATYEIRTLDVNAIIRKTSEMFGRTRKEIVIKSCHEEHLADVDADGGQIEQMLLNLYLNASQAMPGGGTLTLTTENVTLDKRFVRPYSLKAGRYVKISVEDTGEGMDEKTKERIFEPFFTTRKAGSGTGLGLASVYNVVKAHDGLITVYSEKGRGTVFCIYLPASKKTAEKVNDAPMEPRPVEKGAETILLVDDEEAVTSVSKDMLEVLGYSVLIARSGQEAIEIFEKYRDAIDLVVLDVVMPDMGGEETLARLRSIKPSVVVTLSSGYSLDRQVTKIMQQGCKSFIQKPFTINVLSQKLREALDS